jgi:hypothetical protein
MRRLQKKTKFVLIWCSSSCRRRRTGPQSQSGLTRQNARLSGRCMGRKEMGCVWLREGVEMARELAWWVACRLLRGLTRASLVEKETTQLLMLLRVAPSAPCT